MAMTTRRRGPAVNNNIHQYALESSRTPTLTQPRTHDRVADNTLQSMPTEADGSWKYTRPTVPEAIPNCKEAITKTLQKAQCRSPFRVDCIIAGRSSTLIRFEKVGGGKLFCIVSSRSLAFSNLINMVPLQKLYKTIQKSPLSITKLETVVHFQAIASCLLGLRKLGEGSWM